MNPESGGPTTSDILALGKRIAADLDDHDLLGRWISHYIAERLANLESLVGEDRENARDQIANLVARLWASRQGSPLRSDPLGSAEAVERALERLDPARPSWAYYRPFAESFEPSVEQTEAFRPLNLALRLDRAVGDLVHDLIAYAAVSAVTADADWLHLAGAVEQFQDRHLRDLARIMEGDDVADYPAGAVDHHLESISASVECCLELLKRVSELPEDTHLPTTEPD